MFMRKTFPALCSISLLLCLLFLAGCGDSSAARTEARRLFDRLAGQIEDLDIRMEEIEDELADLSTQIETLANRPAGNGAAPADLANLRAQDQQMSQQLTTLQQRLDAISGTITEIENTQSTTTLVTPSQSDVPDENVPGVVTATPQPNQAGSTAREGFYVTLGPNESLEDIAQRYSCTVQDLLNANALPPNAHLLPGQSVFIPGR